MIAPFCDVLVLTGPTASGKTKLALELAAGLNAEIVAMDALTLYRGLDVGTAKPSAAERGRVPYHLLDVLDPWESANVAWWLDRAAACCRDIRSRGHRPLFVGGTALYLKAMCFGLFDGPAADPVLRRKLAAEVEEEGAEVMHRRLAEVDPASAARLHPNDVRRVIRALEVWHRTGQPLSQWQREWSRAPEDAGPQTPAILCLDVPRGELNARIDARVRQMVAGGLLEEARALRALPRPLSREAAQAVGYREAFDYLDEKADLQEMIARIQTRTRQFAKRQMTWFRHLPGCRFVPKELTAAAWGLRMGRPD